MRNPGKQASDVKLILWRWLMLVGGLWVFLAIVYGILAVQTHRRERQLLHEGVTLVQSLIENAGLPLLEQDVKTLHQLLAELGNQPQVLYASVVDHKNKIIAFTDAGQFFPTRSNKTQKIEGIEAWQDKDAMIFAGPVNFSQVPIGEIRLALSTAPVTRNTTVFGIIVALTLTPVFILFLVGHGRWLVQWGTNLIGRKKCGTGIRLVVCPLCGHHWAKGNEFCQELDMDQSTVFRYSRSVPRPGATIQYSLADIGGDPDLAQVKFHILRQCADIIKKLAVPHNRQG